MQDDYVEKLCPYCKCALKQEDDIVICSSCEMPHHKDCWVENMGCTTYGCSGTIQSPNAVQQPTTGSTLDLTASPQNFCTSCGCRLSPGWQFCNHCGKPIASPAPAPQYVQPPVQTPTIPGTGYANPVPKAPHSEQPVFTSGTIILCYLGILALIPFSKYPNAHFIRFHVNQGLILTILQVVVGIFFSIFPLLGWLGSIAWLILVIKGIRNGLQAKEEELPVIGKFRLFKI